MNIYILKVATYLATYLKLQISPQTVASNKELWLTPSSTWSEQHCPISFHFDSVQFSYACSYLHFV